MKEQIEKPEDAVLYLTECTLATVAHMAMIKSKSKGEFDRQIAIAQTGIDTIKMFDLKAARGTRVEQIVSQQGMNVAKWVVEFLSSPAK